MLMVILGAGASYDSLPAYPGSGGVTYAERPPLADELFDNRPIFGDAMASFTRVQPIVPLLQRRYGLSLEQRLQELAGEASDYPIRLQQLMAVRYYIQDVLWTSERDWLNKIGHHVTNHKALLDQINRWIPPKETVCFVTFNYDRLLEDAFRTFDIPIKQMGDYVTHNRFKLFKVHGSIDWVRPAGLPMIDDPNQWAAAEAVMRDAARLKIEDSFWIADAHPTGRRENFLVVPALAIPLEHKTTFECPADHLSLLTKLIPEVDRLLVIGWRATEYAFLQLLANGLPRPVLGYVCAANEGAGKAAANNLLKAGIKGDFKIDTEGFTEMIARRNLDSFLGKTGAKP